jgi:hypothetical protein
MAALPAAARKLRTMSGKRCDPCHRQRARGAVASRDRGNGLGRACQAALQAGPAGHGAGPGDLLAGADRRRPQPNWIAIGAWVSARLAGLAALADDPGVRAGIFTFEVHTCRGFPGDALPF